MKICSKTFILTLAGTAFVWLGLDTTYALESAVPTAVTAKAITANEDALKIHYYRPLYFAFGQLSKVQLAFRSPLFTDSPINFAYSQLLFWELFGPAQHFYDATYNPEIFYRLKLNRRNLYSIDFGIYEHKSNGEAGTPAARSFDQSYIRLNFGFDDPSWTVLIQAKLKVLYDLDDTNADIIQYESPIDFEVRWLKFLDFWVDESEFDMTFHPGGQLGQEWDEGGYEFGWSFRLGVLKMVPLFYFQYYHGFDETLLAYNQSVDEFRFGLRF